VPCGFEKTFHLAGQLWCGLESLLQLSSGLCTLLCPMFYECKSISVAMFEICDTAPLPRFYNFKSELNNSWPQRNRSGDTLQT
jgi:hypothetical protein